MDHESAVREVQKIELHRHLEGSVRPATVVDICREHEITIPDCDQRNLLSVLQLNSPAANLEGFFLPFRFIKYAFVNKEAIARITFEAIEDAAKDRVECVELRFSPEFMAFCHNLKLRDVMDGVVEGLEAARHKYTTYVGLIVSISRHLSAQTMGMPWPTPRELMRLALAYTDRGVVGLDLSGKESGFPAEAFKQVFMDARMEGLGITVHAGEDAGSDSVRSAILNLQAKRIGHGVHIVEDPDVMRLAKDLAIAFEICPTSNVLTHAVESIEEHPLRQMYEYGLPITINTDDPAICGVTLSGEYALIMDKFDLAMPDVQNMIRTAQRWSFMDI